MQELIGWNTVDRPGYLGSKKDNQLSEWNKRYGQGNWRIAWEVLPGEFWNFDRVFWEIYVPGYTAYFRKHWLRARYVSKKYAYAYDEDPVAKIDAFTPHALVDKPGHANQFHHVAMNIALERYLGREFQGKEPLQVRENSRLSRRQQPKGWRYSPGRIPAVVDYVLPAYRKNGWWKKGSIEDVYQSTKVLQVRRYR